MQRVAIRRLGLWSVFKLSLVAYLLLFAIAFVILLGVYLVSLGVGALTAEQQSQALEQIGLSGGLVLLFAFFGGIFAALFYAVMNWLAAVIYNALAAITGGIEVLVEKEAEVGPKPSYEGEQIRGPALPR